MHWQVHLRLELPPFVRGARDMANADNVVVISRVMSLCLSLREKKKTTTTINNNTNNNNNNSHDNNEIP